MTKSFEKKLRNEVASEIRSIKSFVMYENLSHVLFEKEKNDINKVSGVGKVQLYNYILH